MITIGQHRIIFQDSTIANGAMSSQPFDLEQTMAISSKDSHAKLPTTAAKVLVTAGKTDRLEYHLTKPANLIGSQGAPRFG